MKGVKVYHKIKALSDETSYRDCARRLGISINTVKKYRKMSMEEAASYFGRSTRPSQFEKAREFIIDQLRRFPRLKSPKLLRKIKTRYPLITAGERALRRYISPIRQQLKTEGSRKIRYYAPVLDMKPAVQVQVDIGEIMVERNEEGERFKVYFVSFVFSYSRKKYMTFQGRCYDTDSFIDAHIKAFSYFGGIAQEYVYDQTKLVVINERYREVWFNERFYQFACQCGFKIHVCEGYDPESKGKVENSICYIKNDFLYGDYFETIDAVNKEAYNWLDEVANHRIHSVTRRPPNEMFEEERPHLKPLPSIFEAHCLRKADKTGLISFEGNKYSVPFKYQRQQVWVEKVEDQLLIKDRLSGSKLAQYTLSKFKGQIIKNNNHYRDYRKPLEAISKEAVKLFDSLEASAILILRLKVDNAAIARDQLRGLISLRKKYSDEIWQECLPLILELPRLRVSLIEAVLQNCQDRHKAKAAAAEYPENCISASQLDRPLDTYMEVIAND